MARATLVRKSKRGNARTCDVCGQPIEPGQMYYTWKFNFGPSFGQHAEHGAPRPSKLTESKMGEVLDAVQDFDISQATTADDIEAAMNDVASSARSVAGQYGEAADTIEESWPSGNPTSEACRATQEELEAWADDLEGWRPEEDFDEDGDEEAWLEEIRGQAQDIVDSIPEYQG